MRWSVIIRNWNLIKIGIFLPFAFLGFGIPSAAQAQPSTPYLIAATFYISVDDWADVWLNDIPIIDSLRRTGAAKGPQKTEAFPETLCLFKGENILAMEVDDSTRPPDPKNDYVGIAYVLQLDFSDGTRKILSSNEADQHLSFYIPSYQMGNPTGWQRFKFDDHSWRAAKITGSSIPDLSPLDSPELTGIFQFLSAASYSSKALYPGERHLFRRKFFLDISPNPNCDTSSHGPRIKPVIVLLPDRRHSKVFSPPLPTATAIPLPRARVKPTATIVPTIDYPPVVKAQNERRIWMTPTATAPTVLPQPAETAPLPEPSPITAAQTLLPAPTAVFTQTASSPMGQTIVFDIPPANIYMSFADGPGVYRLEIFNQLGHPIKNLFEIKVVAQPDAWAEWDGTNDGGQSTPPGMYYVVYSKDGRELRKMNLLKVGTSKEP